LFAGFAGLLAWTACPTNSLMLADSSWWHPPENYQYETPTLVWNLLCALVVALKPYWAKQNAFWV
jgi:hypothetical protein